VQKNSPTPDSPTPESPTPDSLTPEHHKPLSGRQERRKSKEETSPNQTPQTPIEKKEERLKLVPQNCNDSLPERLLLHHRRLVVLPEPTSRLDRVRPPEPGVTRPGPRGRHPWERLLVRLGVLGPLPEDGLDAVRLPEDAGDQPLPGGLVGLALQGPGLVLGRATGSAARWRRRADGLLGLPQAVAELAQGVCRPRALA
jgi:hypothetical protein